MNLLEEFRCVIKTNCFKLYPGSTFDNLLPGRED